MNINQREGNLIWAALTDYYEYIKTLGDEDKTAEVGKLRHRVFVEKAKLPR